MKGNRKGFTLIELLVVIAIIAILAAILFPVFTAARSAAMRTKCMSNLRNIHAASTAYATDFGDKFTPAVSYAEDGTTLSWVPWWNKLRPYIAARLAKGDINNQKPEGVLTCPLTPKIPSESTTFQRSYAFSMCYRQYQKNGGLQDVRNVGVISVPSKTVMIAEVWRLDNLGSAYVFPPSEYRDEDNNVVSGGQPANVTYGGTGGKEFIIPTGWHGGKSAVLWFDGHVTMEKTSEPKVPCSMNPPAGWNQTGIMTTSTTLPNLYFRLDGRKIK